jgi:hypothetical protein
VRKGRRGERTLGQQVDELQESFYTKNAKDMILYQTALHNLLSEFQQIPHARYKLHYFHKLLQVADQACGGVVKRMEVKFLMLTLKIMEGITNASTGFWTLILYDMDELIAFFALIS